MDFPPFCCHLSCIDRLFRDISDHLWEQVLLEVSTQLNQLPRASILSQIRRGR